MTAHFAVVPNTEICIVTAEDRQAILVLENNGRAPLTVASILQKEG